MCDGFPGVVFLVVSFPTNFVKSSPYFTITNLENEFHTGSKYDVVVRTLLSGHVRCDRCGTLLCISGVLFPAYSLRLCPAVPHVQTSPWHCHCPLRPSSVTSLTPSPNLSSVSSLRNNKIWQFFFWPVGRLVTVIQVREVHRVLGQGDTRFFYSVN